MNPSGSAAAKKRASAAPSRSPAQPKTTASGAPAAAAARSADNDAPDLSRLQGAADPIAGEIVDGTGLDAVVDALVAEIGTHRARRKRTEQVRIASPDAVPLDTSGTGAAHRAELQPDIAGLCRRPVRGCRRHRRGRRG